MARIFAAYADGDSYAGIARALDREGVPSPSAHDPSRSRHRHQEGWAESAVRAILTNPRYTGRQVWGRQPRHEALVDPADVAAGYTTHQRWADEEE